MIGTYCLWFLPSLWPFVWAIIIMKVFSKRHKRSIAYNNVSLSAAVRSNEPELFQILQGLQAQKFMWGPAWATVLAAALNVPLTWLLCRQYDFLGAALANAASRILQFFAMIGKSETPGVTELTLYLLQEHDNQTLP